MAVFHVNASYISKGAGGGAQALAQYLHRARADLAEQHHRYLDREGRGKEDLIASGHEHLPAWANGNDHTFWLAADRSERKNGVVARVVELSLPRELSAQGQRDLADDIRQTFFRDHAHSWAIHAPAARDGSGVQPHMHIMFSPRANDEHARSPHQYFRRYNPTHPERGGARKDPSWDTKGRLQDIRGGVAVLTNASLEREGLPLAVTHLSLRAQGLERDPARYRDPDNTQDMAQTQAYRDRLHQGGERDFEQELARAAWSQQKQRDGLHDLSRDAIVDRVRDHAFRYDRSPRRDRERQQSFARSLARTRAPVPLERTQTPRERSPERPRTPARPLARTLRDLRAALERGDEVGGGAVFRPRLREDDHEHERGMGW